MTEEEEEEASSACRILTMLTSFLISDANQQAHCESIYLFKFYITSIVFGAFIDLTTHSHNGKHNIYMAVCQCGFSYRLK